MSIQKPKQNSISVFEGEGITLRQTPLGIEIAKKHHSPSQGHGAIAPGLSGSSGVTIPLCTRKKLKGPLSGLTSRKRNATGGHWGKPSESPVCPHLTSLCTAQRMAAIVAHY
ncbi:MAG: hypothetical protein ACPG4X_20145 [Pikeienuella sp.]